MRWLLALLAALVFIAPGPANAEERILHFLSDVQVEADGALSVTETIRVRVEGVAIKRGIYRDFPTDYRGPAGRRMRVGFDVSEVRRNGQPEPWKASPEGNGVRILIGDEDIFLPIGEHEYVIRYRTTRQLGFFRDYDELYWNATGNGWIFPIDVAEARIRLPQPAPFGQRAFYTGPQGASGDNARIVAERPGDIWFRTTAPLGIYEGLTVAVAWPKGVVSPPGPSTRFGWWLQDNGPPAVALVGLLGVFGFYFHAWRRAGRNPRPGTIVPIFSPPEGLSAAAVRYIRKMGSDNRAFAAALVQLGVLGKLRLVEGEKGFFTGARTTIERKDSDQVVPSAEADMMTKLFEGGNSVLMDDKNHATFSGAQNALRASLKRQFEGSLFVRNWMWAVWGTLALFVAIWLTAAAVLLTASLGIDSLMAIRLPLAGLAALALATFLYRCSRKPDSKLGLPGQIGLAFIGLIAFGLGFATIGMALATGRVLPLLIPLAALPVVISAYSWMAAHTREGRGVLDRIEGFRHYLAITEEERLETLHPPEKTPELFERFLPYAIALEVENEWASRFTRILAAAAAAGTASTFGWYSGHSNPWSDTDSFVDRVGSSLTSTISSSSTAPGSSSGSGGGGSSGGGGGGGGGGGW
ncbi:DUF2207 domain-containing protein [Sphingosinicella rhizophila]|uniref:DUF2207 domain-containing protein n=1 Tax=Sphingosinicella rhizophila TaxID=3050082 RepID=A0ABU3Q2P7_9SPHN|nr:DUF2207 domain-containing protein [Sphingosinicella sp. GR2756]MDT9597675.1 DUF2207 domain-containing protein [Sphingosinicella sp. GR2756]